MLKAEQVPDEAAIAHCGGDILGLDMSDPEEVKYREASIWNAKVNIADAINAWPGMEIEMVFVEEDYLILPLRKEG
tara:strand:- start:31906 stop:32133 length:228 start_codon:yes stop_codon:yes gene_type:complete